MQDLQEVTHDLHYENYRATRLADGSDSDGPGNLSRISFIIVTINIRRSGQTTCSCTKIRYRYQAERKGSWIGSYASNAATNATTAQTTKSSSVLVFITQRLNYNLGQDPRPLPCIKLPILCEIAPKFKKKKWSKLYSKMYIGSRSLMLY